MSTKRVNTGGLLSQVSPLSRDLRKQRQPSEISFQDPFEKYNLNKESIAEYNTAEAKYICFQSDFSSCIPEQTACSKEQNINMASTLTMPRYLEDARFLQP